VTPYEIVSPAPRPVWHELLASDRGAQAFQSPAWLDCAVAITGGSDASRLYTFADGRRLVLPMVRRRGLPGRLAVLASQPFGWGVGGLLAGASQVTESDVTAVLADLTQLPAVRVSVRPPSRDAAVYQAAVPSDVIRTPHREQVLELGEFGALWQDRFSGHARRSVRKAEKSDLTVEVDDTGRLIREFYGLYDASVARWAAQQHEPLALARWRARRRDPLRKFVVVARGMGTALRVYLARSAGRPAAAVLVVWQGGTASYWRGAMDKDLAGPTHANALLHKSAIQDACEAGLGWYAMGDSGASASLTRFKESFGATSRDYWGYRVERLPLTAWDAAARRTVKRALRFRD
jgi:hypothetical protein